MSIFIKRISTYFLQFVVVLIGIGTVAFLLWEPQVEGVNAHATTLTEIYFDDPFLAYMYIASIAFFVALYQAFTLLRYVRQNKVFFPNSIQAVRTIQYCGLALVVFILGAEAFIIITQGGKDDITGGIAMGLFGMSASIVMSAAAAVLERILEMKAQQNLTV